jgi:transposase
MLLLLDRNPSSVLGPIKTRRLDQPIAVSLEALVPDDNFYRHLDRSLSLSFGRELVADTYASVGRPSIDPIVFFKLQLVMFFEHITSERELMRTVADRVSVRWYLGYAFGEPLPDHSSLTNIRNRYGLAVFRRFFEAIVEQCQKAHLVWGKELYFDATQVNANASLDSSQPRFAVEAHLNKLFGTKPSEGGEDNGSNQSSEGSGDGQQTEAQAVTDTESVPENSVSNAPVSLPAVASEEVLQGLADQNDGRHDWIDQEGRPDRTVRHGYYQRRTDFVASATDPDAALMRLKHGGSHFGYHDHYVVDGGKKRIILEVLVTPADVMENQPMLDLLWRTCFRWKLWPRQVTGDTTYGTVENIVAIEDANIRAYMPLPDFDQRSPLYGQRKFTYDPERDTYICPQGKLLSRHAVSYTDRKIKYRASPADCSVCPVRAECTTSAEARQVQRSFDEEYLDLVRAYHGTEPYQKAMRKRQVWVEPLFGEAKDWHGLRRFRLRGLWKVNVEALMVATGQNLKRLLSKRGWGRRRWPGGGLALPFCGCPSAVPTDLQQFHNQNLPPPAYGEMLARGFSTG